MIDLLGKLNIYERDIKTLFTMRQVVSFLFFSLLLVSLTSLVSNGHTNLAPAKSPIEGRWDITIDMLGKETPSWLEVTHSGTHILVGQFVGPGGSARPISQVNFENGKVSFWIPPQWETGSNLSFDGNLQGDNLNGVITFPDGKNYNFKAVRAPVLAPKANPVWGKPISLLNGADLQGWHPSGQTNQWTFENGILKSPKPGSNIITDATFTDFKLHVEFRYPANGNSGVYLRGRYEVQI
ncbi:MAG TPA: DUF1080 domain-containing protein, partial [Chitinophagaceae bacterium]